MLFSPWLAVVRRRLSFGWFCRKPCRSILRLYDRRGLGFSPVAACVVLEERVLLSSAGIAIETLINTTVSGDQHFVGQSDRSFAVTAGSDAHTLRRIGTTWTEAPGRTRDEYVDSLRRGLGRPGGAHGSTMTIARDAYSVIGSYVAALAGFGPRDVRSWRRAACLTFSAVSLPFQFMPLVIAARSKAGERRAIDQLIAYSSTAV